MAALVVAMLVWLTSIVPVAVAARGMGIREGRSDLYQAVLSQRLLADSLGRQLARCMP